MTMRSLFMQTHIAHCVKIHFSDFYYRRSLTKDTKQMNDFSRTVTAENTKKYCAILLLTSTVLHLRI